jgi:hypothetical protein
MSRCLDATYGNSIKKVCGNWTSTREQRAEITQRVLGPDRDFFVRITSVGALLDSSWNEAVISDGMSRTGYKRRPNYRA